MCLIRKHGPVRKMPQEKSKRKLWERREAIHPNEDGRVRGGGPGPHAPAPSDTRFPGGHEQRAHGTEVGTARQ